MFECDRGAYIMRGPWRTRGCCAVGKQMIGNERGSVLHQPGGNEESLRQDSGWPAEGRDRPCQEHDRLKQLDC